ncbi:MAG: hypothetical protein OEM38_01210 [Gammaproteobacteria bacterium]|nr:hypothetical protein [Gammaproteobacteria bacterium]
MKETAKSNTALQYQLKFSDGNTIEYEFIDEGMLKLKQPENLPIESWMKLSYHQCENCPLSEDTHPACPVAQNLSVLIKDWSQIISHDNVDLLVSSPQRNVTASTTAQQSLSSLLGLVMATSDCPHTQFFRPMAKFHLPLASSEETSFRAFSSFFLKTYFESPDPSNLKINLEELKAVYENMHTVNIHMKQRLESAVEEDAALNAVVRLDLFALNMPYFMDKELEKLRPLFTS